MIKIIVLLLAGLIFSFFGVIAKEMYQPAFRARNFFLTVFLFLTLATQWAGIYFMALKLPFLAVIELFFFNLYWFYFAPFHPNSDAAGNGMAMGFRSLFNGAASIILGIVSYLLIKFFKQDGTRHGLYIVLAIAAIIGIRNILANQISYLDGDEFAERARWAHLRLDDYRKSLFRARMLEKNDEWEGKDLDAVPEELTHWDVYGCKTIRVKTYSQLCCYLLDARFGFPKDTYELILTGLICGNLGYAGKDIDDRPVYVPLKVILAWYDLSDRKAYKLETELPEELNHYFDDLERFELDDLEFRIMPHGKVVMFHNHNNQIHNIMLDHPLQAEVTNDYEQGVSEFLQKREDYIKTHERIGESLSENVDFPSLDKLNDYQKRYNYTILFRSESTRFEITKTICNFFNGEKILSGGEWKEDLKPARLKDVFLRFEDKNCKSSCFLYFNEEEILRAFESLDESAEAEFVIRVGDRKSDFSFEVKAGDKCFSLSKTEIRLYRNDEEDGGKLIFKNYKGQRKNRLYGCAGRMSV